ncbi:MAG: hypothetical protein NT154_10835 [Verrucomicrobia bacterium]|nr:hypothetical protein [Verrucomicrobiota bacterium]
MPSMVPATPSHTTATGLPVADQDANLQTNLINPALPRGADFQGFYADRKAVLIRIIKRATGNADVKSGGDAPAEGAEEDDADD